MRCLTLEAHAVMREKKNTITRVCPASDKGRDSLRAHLFLQLCFCSTGRCPGNSSHSPLFLLHSYPSAHAHLLLFSLSVMSDSFATPCCNPPGSSVRGILQARVLEWVAMPSSRGSSRPRDQTCISCIDRQILYHCATLEALKML